MSKELKEQYIKNRPPETILTEKQTLLKVTEILHEAGFDLNRRFEEGELEMTASGQDSTGKVMEIHIEVSTPPSKQDD